MSRIHVKPRRKQYGPTNPLPLHKVETRGKPRKPHDVVNFQTSRRHEVDARPIVAERQRMEALRARQGLVSEWTRIINNLDADLRGMAHALMDEITDFFVRRSLSPQSAWSLA